MATKTEKGYRLEKGDTIYNVITNGRITQSFVERVTPTMAIMVHGNRLKRFGNPVDIDPLFLFRPITSDAYRDCEAIVFNPVKRINSIG